MFRRIKNFILFLGLAGRVYHANRSHGGYHRYARKVAADAIRESRQANDGSIPELVFKKIEWYMVDLLFMAGIISELTSHKLSKNEKEASLYLGAMMALFDVIIDDLKIQDSVVIDLLRTSFTRGEIPALKISTATEKVFELYLRKLFVLIPEERWAGIIQQLDLIEFQLKSRQQFSHAVTEESIKMITIGKGGAGVLLSLTILPVSIAEMGKAMMETGGFIQMMNDCQDMYKDSRDGIVTFLRFCKSFTEIAEKLDEQRRIAFSKLMALPYPFRNRYRAVFTFNAMYVVILYKLQKYAEVCGNKLDFQAIALMDKEKFRVNPFSAGAVFYCFGRIVGFRRESGRVKVIMMSREGS